MIQFKIIVASKSYKKPINIKIIYKNKILTNMDRVVSSDTVLNLAYLVYDRNYTDWKVRYLGITFVSLYVILSIFLTYYFWTKHNHFPIRGRASLISLLLNYFACAQVICPILASLLWDLEVTKSKSESYVHIITKILASIYFVSMRL